MARAIFLRVSDNRDILLCHFRQGEMDLRMVTPSLQNVMERYGPVKQGHETNLTLYDQRAPFNSTEEREMCELIISRILDTINCLPADFEHIRYKSLSVLIYAIDIKLPSEILFKILERTPTDQLNYHNYLDVGWEECCTVYSKVLLTSDNHFNFKLARKLLERGAVPACANHVIVTCS